uniref:AlNc14C243G9514 protein n=1 Tax=Albugo laibachii Nc14 TaxID=890382 RepID=F0WT28_9STRA|nr:AlNc14C243G9514 [Albugo laibachii Nc14]|eukprot:CCA24514.1 AlNc14C243G9514 [Albugo laibachii Nc14]
MENDTARTFGGARALTESDLKEVKKIDQQIKKEKRWLKTKLKRAIDKRILKGSASVKPNEEPDTRYRDRAAERRQRAPNETDLITNRDVHDSPIRDIPSEPFKKTCEKEIDVQSTLQKIKQALKEAKESQAINNKSDVRIHSTAGRLILFHASQQASCHGNECSHDFQSGRMMYTFKVASKGYESTPTIVRKSIEYGESEKQLSGFVSDTITEQVGGALRNHRSNTKNKIESKPKMNQDDTLPLSSKITEPMSDEDDEDIFPNIGKYIPVDLRESESCRSLFQKEVKNGDISGKYFADLSASITAASELEKEEETKKELAWKESLVNVIKAQGKRQRNDEESSASQQYEECYPEYQIGQSSYDSDTEEPTIGKKQKKSTTRKQGSSSSN